MAIGRLGAPTIRDVLHYAQSEARGLELAAGVGGGACDARHVDRDHQVSRVEGHHDPHDVVGVAPGMKDRAIDELTGHQPGVVEERVGLERILESTPGQPGRAIIAAQR